MVEIVDFGGGVGVKVGVEEDVPVVFDALFEEVVFEGPREEVNDGRVADAEGAEVETDWEVIADEGMRGELASDGAATAVGIGEVGVNTVDARGDVGAAKCVGCLLDFL